MGVVQPSLCPQVDRGAATCGESSPSEAMFAMPEVLVESSLPEEWVPEGAGAYVFVRRDADDAHQWEALLPEFSIAGMGVSPEAAARNALELLDDYLVLCAREGRSFAECRRLIGRRSRLSLMGEMLAELARSNVKRPPGGRSSERYRVPLRLTGAH
jgi:hypothetical protein